MSKDIQLAIRKILIPSNISRIITRYLVNPKAIKRREKEFSELIEDITFTIKSLKKILKKDKPDAISICEIQEQIDYLYKKLLENPAINQKKLCKAFKKINSKLKEHIKSREEAIKFLEEIPWVKETTSRQTHIKERRPSEDDEELIFPASKMAPIRVQRSARAKHTTIAIPPVEPEIAEDKPKRPAGSARTAIRDLKRQ